MVEEIKLIQTKVEKQRDELFVRAMNHGVITKEEFNTSTDGELLDKIYKQVVQPVTHDPRHMTHDTSENKDMTHDPRHMTHNPWGIDGKLLATVAMNPNLSRKDLLGLLNISRKTLYRKLSPLLHNKLVEEKKDPDNWRIKHLMITDLGSKYLKKYGGE